MFNLVKFIIILSYSILIGENNLLVSIKIVFPKACAFDKIIAFCRFDVCPVIFLKPYKGFYIYIGQNVPFNNNFSAIKTINKVCIKFPVAALRLQIRLGIRKFICCTYYLEIGYITVTYRQRLEFLRNVYQINFVGQMDYPLYLNPLTGIRSKVFYILHSILHIRTIN